MTTTMTTTIIDRLNATINDRVAAQLAQFDGLEAQIVAAIQAAEAEATRRINAVAESIDGTLRAELAALDERLAVIASNAFAAACDRIAATLDPSTQATTTTEPEPEQIADPEPTPEPSPAWEGWRDDRQEGQESLDDEPTPATVAAHALDCGYAVESAVDEDDDTDDDEPEVDADDDSALMATAADHESRPDTTYDPADLHEKRGQGRGSRYIRVTDPEYGQTYFRKIDNRWQPVTYIEFPGYTG